MANIERLTKRVKVMEDWIAENEEMGGPRGMLDTMSFLVQESRRIGAMAEGINNNFMNLQNLNREFLMARELGEEWNEYIQEKEKEDALQKQTTKKVPSRKKSETGKKVGKENPKKAKTSKKSKKE